MISNLPDRMKKPLTAVNNSLNGKVSNLSGRLSIGQLVIQWVSLIAVLDSSLDRGTGFSTGMWDWNQGLGR